MNQEVQFSVRIAGDTAYLSVEGRANYLNCKKVGEFFDLVLRKKLKHLRVDFYACNGMDSTFMGMLAGVTLRLAVPEIGGDVNFYNLKGRNLELIENLGLDNIANIASNGDFYSMPDSQILSGEGVSKTEILEAHQNLVNANPKNNRAFEDVIKFLQAEIDADKS